ncbi:MAG: hypothetical protein ABEK29_04215 [Bradymonadaceae bacterium]
MESQRSPFFVLFIVACAAILAWPTLAAAEVPDTLNYSGTLQKDSQPFDGTVETTFTFYDSETGGQEVWSETISTLRVEDGHLDATLGTQNPLDGIAEGDDLWLEVSVNGTVLTPRKHVGSLSRSKLLASNVNTALDELAKHRARIAKNGARIASLEQKSHQTGNFVTTTAAQRRSCQNLCSRVVTLEDKTQTLENKTQTLENKTQDMTRTTVDNQASVLFTGVNVHVRNGVGSTDSTNGPDRRLQRGGEQ